MKKKIATQKIALAFRITLFMPHEDEQIFCKRLSNLLDSLDRLNKRGIVIKISWIIPLRETLRPIAKVNRELLDHIRLRVSVGYDEINLCPSNYAPLPLLTDDELAFTIGEEISNPSHDGVKDIFGSYEPNSIFPGRLYSADLLPQLSNLGIKVVSFNLFGLDGEVYKWAHEEFSFVQKHNPLWLMRSGFKDKMIFVPSYSEIDIKNYLSLKRMIRKCRELQVATKKSDEIILLFDLPLHSSCFFAVDRDENSTECILESLVNEIIKMPFVYFTTVSSYVEGHEARGILTLDRDCLFYDAGDLSNWADKWETREIWSLVEKSRLLQQQAIKIAKSSGSRKLVGEVSDLVLRSREFALDALALKYSNPRGHLALKEAYKVGLEYATKSYDLANSAYTLLEEKSKLTALQFKPLTFRESILEASGDDLQIGENFIENSFFKIEKKPRNFVNLTVKEFMLANCYTLGCEVTYNGRRFFDRGSVEYISTKSGAAQFLIKGRIHGVGLKGYIDWQHLYTLSAGVPYLSVNVEIDFCELKGNLLQEIKPIFIQLPRLSWRPSKFRVWKDSLHSTKQSLKAIDSHLITSEKIFHSQIGRSWFAFSSYSFGLLIAQKRSNFCSFAFSPIQFNRRGKDSFIQINLMGCLKNELFTPKAKSHIARLIYRRRRSEHFYSASTYKNKKISSSFMIAPFCDKKIPEKIVADAVDFSTQIYREKFKEKEFSVTG